MTTEKNDDIQLSLEPLPDLLPIIEALIFASREPITIDKIVETLQAADINVHNKEVRQALKSLEALWSDRERPLARGLILKNIAGGWVFATATEQASVVKKIIQEKPLQLSKAQIEVLSVVAYRQPLTRVDIDEIRGVDSSFAIKKLMQLKLLKILGKSEGLGRPLLYGTTKEFLEFFALNSLNDLPTLKQYESLGAGEEQNEIDLTAENISLKDLFLDAKKSPMFSADVERLSEEALESLNDALLRAETIEKTPPVKE